MSPRLIQPPLAALLFLLPAYLIFTRGVEHSNLISLQYATEQHPAPLHVSIFAIWRGNADASPPHRIKLRAIAPDADAIWTYIDPRTLQCFDTQGSGAPKAQPLGQLSPALLHDRIAPLAPNLQDLQPALAEADAYIRRIAARGYPAMNLTPAPPTDIDFSADLRRAEFPHWWTTNTVPGEAFSPAPSPSSPPPPSPSAASSPPSSSSSAPSNAAALPTRPTNRTAPKGPESQSPGQRPGHEPPRHQALKGRPNDRPRSPAP